MMKRTQFNIRADRRLYQNDFGLFVFGDVVDGRRPVVTNAIVDMIDVAEVMQYPDPPLTLNYAGAEQLMSDLWNAGVRPKDQHDLPGETRAQAKHIDDLRTIAHKLVDFAVSNRKP